MTSKNFITIYIVYKIGVLKLHKNGALVLDDRSCVHKEIKQAKTKSLVVAAYKPSKPELVIVGKSVYSVSERRVPGLGLKAINKSIRTESVLTDVFESSFGDTIK